jgi:hypothetical protein
MARHYSPKAVLRHLPLDLLRTFLNQQDIPTAGGPLWPNWDALTDGDTTALYAAWRDLPNGPRERVELMLRQVHDMASEAGVREMIREALFRGPDIADQLAPLEGHHAKALWVLLNCGPAFHTARRLLSAASPVGRFWNLTTGFSGEAFDVTQTALAALRASIAALYREQGRGHICTVEHFERDGVLYVFLYLDDYTQTHTAHNALGTLTRSPLRPAFELVFVYTQSAGTLDLYARGDRRWRSVLRDRFCEHVLHTTVPLATPGRRSYQLNGLIDRTFPLDTDPHRGILSAIVRRLRIVPADCLDQRVTLETTSGRAREVYDMLDVHFPIERFPRCDLFVNLVTFTVTYVPNGEEGVRPLTFDVSFPDGCNLKSLSHDQREVGEWCLRQWGILNEAGEEGDSGECDDGCADEE